MSFSKISFTNAGRALQAKALAGTPLVFTKIALGSGSLNGRDPATFTSLLELKVSLSISKTTREGQQVMLEANFSNQDNNTGFYWREVGLFANDPTLGEILYCYGNAGNVAEYIQPSTSSSIEKVITLTAVVGNAQNVTAIINTAAFATKKDISAMTMSLSEVNSKLAQTANEKADKAELEREKQRIDTIVNSANDYYMKCASADTGALQIVADTATPTTNQIKLSSVSPTLSSYVPIVGDYVHKLSNTLTAGLNDMKIGADGKVYDNAGNAIREQFDSVNKTLVNVVNYSNQYLDKSNWVDNFYWNNGNMSSSTGFTAYKYPIKLKAGSYLCTSNIHHSFTQYKNTDGTWVKPKTQTSNKIVFDTDVELYVTLLPNSEKNKAMIVDGYELPYSYVYGNYDYKLGQKITDKIAEIIGETDLFENMNNPTNRVLGKTNTGYVLPQTNSIIDEQPYTNYFKPNGEYYFEVSFEYYSDVPAVLKTWLFGKNGTSLFPKQVSSDVQKKIFSVKFDPAYFEVYNNETEFRFLVFNNTINSNIYIDNFRIRQNAIMSSDYNANDVYSIQKKMADDILTVKTKIEEIKTGDTQTIVSPSGYKYLLGVSDDGDLIAIRAIPKKAVIFGNSLVFGFSMKFGMCATDSMHDYYHYLKTYLSEKVEGFSISKVYSSPMESATTIAEQNDFIDNAVSSVAADTDWISLQMGDNVNTDAKRAIFYDGAERLIKKLRVKAPKARITWIAEWYTGASITIIAEICKKYGVQMINISNLRNDETQGYIGQIVTFDDGSTRVVDSTGVSSHPGNKGMRLIANRILYETGMSDTEETFPTSYDS